MIVCYYCYYYIIIIGVSVQHIWRIIHIYYNVGANLCVSTRHELSHYFIVVITFWYHYFIDCCRHCCCTFWRSKGTVTHTYTHSRQWNNLCRSCTFTGGIWATYTLYTIYERVYKRSMIWGKFYNWLKLENCCMGLMCVYVYVIVSDSWSWNWTRNLNATTREPQLVTSFAHINIFVYVCVFNDKNLYCAVAWVVGNRKYIYILVNFTHFTDMEICVFSSIIDILQHCIGYSPHWAHAQTICRYLSIASN